MSNDLPMRSRPNRSPDGPRPRRGSSRRLSAPPPEVGAEYDWGRYISSIKRFKWLIVVTAALGTAATVAWARMAKPRYKARATVWVDVVDRRGAIRDAPIQSGEPLRSAARVDLVRSPVVLEPVVRDRRLYVRTELPVDAAALEPFLVSQKDYRSGRFRLQVDGSAKSYTLLSADGATLEEGTVGDSVGRSLGWLWEPPASALPAGRTVPFSVVSLEEAMRQLSTSLRVDTLGGNFMHLELVGGNAEATAATVNEIAQRFVDVAVELKRLRLTEVVTILNDAQRRAAQNLSRAENTLNNFLVRNADLLAQMSSEGRRDPAAASALFDLRLAKEGLRRDREAIERVLAQAADSGLAVAVLEALEPVKRSSEMTAALTLLTKKKAELRALQLRYTEEHPPVRRLVDEVQALERQTIPALARGLVNELVVQEQHLADQAGTAATGLRQLPPLAIEEARLRRELALAETHLETVKAKYDEAQLAETTSPTDARILTLAETPNRSMGGGVAPIMVVIALLGSAGLGAMGAVVLDRLDPKLQHPDQVSRDLGLPILGALPRINRPHGNGERSAAQIVEALRGIRLNLVHAYGAAGPLVVTITSPGSGDGKSFLASNLALAFAEAGHRTLLIDADVRRGALHKSMNLPRTPGLTDYLAGKAVREATVQSTQYPSVFFIPCGTRMQNAPELLTSPAMSQFIMSLRSSYSVILVDTPPLAAGVDSLALGTLCGHMLLVLRTGSTDLDFAQAKLEVLERLPIRLLGAVLNDVHVGGRDRHYGYYSYYLPGYEARDEEQTAAKDQLPEPARPPA